MTSALSTHELLHKLLEWQHSSSSRGLAAARSVADVPDPDTGRPLKIASVDVSDRAMCPSCAQLGRGGYVSFVADLRLAFACASCCELVWVAGA